MSDPIDDFLNMLPGTLGDDREIVAALDSLVYSERTQAVTAWLDSPNAERRLAAALTGISYDSKPLTELDAAYLAKRQLAVLRETP